MDKKEIRKLALEKRGKMSEAEVEEKSHQIISKLEAQSVFQEAKNVLFYYSQGNEAKTKEVIESYLQKKNIYLPKFIDADHFIPVLCKDLKMLQKGHYDLLEPSESDEVSVPKLDLIILPGVAFDERGNRIGRGKGHYDRFLGDQKDVFKLALTYEAQIFDELPKDPYDVGVDMILTEKRIIHCTN